MEQQLNGRATRRGFTLVEIMIVVAIIGILVAIAVPGYIKAREKAQVNACQEGQSKLQGAIDTWALEEGKGTGDQPEWGELIGVQTYLKRTPVCPLDRNPEDGAPDVLEIQPVGTAVSCINGEHD